MNFTFIRNLPFLNGTPEGRLKWKPDLVVFDHSDVDITRGSVLYERKGFSFWESCLAFELKFNRTKSVHCFHHSWQSDIRKLGDIRRRHYENTDKHFYGAFVLFSRTLIPRMVFDEIDAYSRTVDIKPICYSLNP